MDALMFLRMVMVLVAVGATGDYVRPLPRELLHFPKISKPAGFPQQVHVSLAGANHMRVTWIGSDKLSLPLVEYGKSSKNYTSKAEGETTRYRFLAYHSGTIHHTVIGPLEDNTIYYYRCGGDGPEFSLKTPPSQFPINFVVAGDLGQTGWTKSTLEHIQADEHDVLLLPGDLSYADFFQPRWDTFGELVQPLASARPWMVTNGNHDKEYVPVVKQSFLAFNSRWKMPYSESGSSSNLFYSFDVAGVHILMLGSYADYGVDSDQYKWLKADLSKVDREKTPWLIALFHVPWYNSNKAHQGEGNGMMAAMEPLLHDAAVDVVFVGHVHAYERTNRVFNDKIDPCGTLHITIGDGGNREGLSNGYEDPKPEWSDFREASFGHGMFKVVNSTHAFWCWHRNDDDEAVQSDRVWIKSLMGSGCLSKKEGTRKNAGGGIGGISSF